MSLQESYRIAIQTEGMIKDLVKNLSSDNDELQMHCASAIFKVTSSLVHIHFMNKCEKMAPSKKHFSYTS